MVSGATQSVLVLLTALGLILIKYPRSRNSSPFSSTPQEKLDVHPPNPYEAITPLPSFNYATTPPLRVRPFKPKFHLTMGLENMPLSELIAMDSTYLTRIHHRRELMRDHPAKTLACNRCAEPAVLELYDWLFRTYLPIRFPTHYSLLPKDAATKETATHLLNRITDEEVPLSPTSTLDALETISAHIDTDFLILLPSPSPPSSPDQPTYHLQAFTTTFPSGFSALSKLSLPLSSIHAPVPGYVTKLEKSMDRFFSRLETGRCVKRANWTVTTHANLFTEAGTHLYAGGGAAAQNNANAKTLDPSAPGLEEQIAAQRAEVKVEECRLRSERQTLHRLPKSGAVVFAFKTYLATLEEVKKDGDGEALAAAIEGFGKGSVPEMEFYKRGVVWGDAVKEYLRS